MNPIRARLDKLHDQWVIFANDPSARLLVWRASADERALIDAFIGRECGERAETPDLFIQLSTPFTDDTAYGVQLADELAAHAAEADLAELRPSPAKDDIETLLRTLGALHILLGERMLAVWLDPVTINDRCLLWLQRLAHAAPTNVRFIVVGDAYDALARAEPARVKQFDCALDMPGAVEAVLDRAGGDGPDARFRRLQARLSARIAANDIEAARETACEAVGIALKHEWPQLAAAVHMMMAAAYVERGNFHAAVASYREAERTAADKRLQLVALLGSAAVLFARASYAPAADVYMRAAVLADDVGDAERTLDCYRLASLCYATLGDRERAWTLGLDGLRIGSRMDPAQRAKSTLRSLSEQLISTFRGDSRERALRTQLAPLLEHG